MKKIGNYLLILVLLVLGLFMIGLLYLFLIPNASLFGITYISDKINKYSPGYSITNEDAVINSIVVNSNAFDVRVVDASSEDEVSVRAFSNSFGFVLKKNSEISISSKLFDGVLTINVTEPTGLMVKNDSFIQLRLPKTLSGVDVTLKNNSATTTLNTESSIKDFSYTTNYGDLKINNANITGDISLNVKRAESTLSNTVALNNNNVTLNLTSGNFVTGDKVKLGNVTLNSMTTGRVNIKECAGFTAEINEAGGNINIGTINGALKIYSSDTKVNIIEQNAGLCDINLTKSGSIKIGTVKNFITAKTHNGAIQIDKAQASADLKSSAGNISVNSAYQKMFVETTSGNINIVYAEDAGSYSTQINDRYLNRSTEIKTESGYVKVTGADNINLDITNNGMSSADIYMHDVLGTNVIKGGKGDIYIETPSNRNITEESEMYKYTLTTSSEKGEVSVNLSQTTSLGTNGYSTNVKVVTYVGKNSENQNLTEEDLAKPENKPWVDNTLTLSTTTGNLTMRNAGLTY